MSSIRVISIPPGDAPERVRKEWVGLVIPLPQQEAGGIQMGVKGGTSKNSGGYQVITAVALDLLFDKSEEAARWFEENSILGTRLVFAKEVCELVA